MYIPTTRKELSLRKQQAYAEFSRIVNWGRRNPAKFAELMIGAKLMDYQLYVFNESWCRPFVAWLMCRGAGKTAITAVYLMTKLMLIPNYKIYICATKQEQAVESFQKIEDIAMNRIPSFKGLTDIFKYELAGAKGHEFSHNPAGYKFKLFNNSGLQTISSNAAGTRGKRGGVWFEEAGWILTESFNVAEKFATVDTDFSTSTTNEKYIQPRQMPLQLLYTSSAGPADMPFYDRYRKFAIHMLAGDPSYFVCNFDVDAILQESSIEGKHIKSHLSEEQVRKEVRDNADSAEMEYYNKFPRGAGSNAVVSQENLIRASDNTLPLFYNDTSDREFVLCFDPARNYDNSILSVFELVKESNGYNLYVRNVISMVNKDSAKKTPMNYVDQLEVVKKTLIAYNGEEASEYENVHLYIDAGAGGGPRSGIADQLLFPWTDKFGVEHRGLVDPDDPQYESDRKKHPENAKIIHLLEPRSYKEKMYGALEEMMSLGLIHFTQYDGHASEITLADSDSSSGYKRHTLTQEERNALVQIELMKKEISYIVRSENPSTRTVRYELARHKQNTMHDDRAYTLAMGAYVLWQKRNTALRSKSTKKKGTLFKARRPVLNIGGEVA